MAPRPKPVTERFWSKVQYNSTTRCWEWSGSTRKGHGRLHVTSKQVVGAHRFVYELLVGDIPTGMCVCHTCDNRRCVNPSHLFLGTQQENIQDMVNKGRQPRPKGTRNARAKLNDELVREIRVLARRGHTQRSLAARYGVSQSRISEAVTGQTWGHIPRKEVNGVIN